MSADTRDDYIPFHRASIDEDDIQAVVETLRSGWITTGPRSREFAESFARYVGAKHALAVNSCTAAMHLSVAALDLSPGDEVITTPYTFVATAEVILYMGAKPVFVDVLPDDANIDPEKIEDAITERTVGIIPVHVAGMPCRMDRIVEITEKHGLWVLEDAAHAIETQFAGRSAGAWGDAGAYSFYPTKNMTTGEGGMLVSDDESLIDRARVLSLHGMSRDAWKRYERTGSWYYEVVERGYKYNITDVAAAMGITQLRKLDGWLEARTQIAADYTAAFADHPALLTPPSAPPDSRHSWHLYPLRVNPESGLAREAVIEELSGRGIGTSVHFIPLHLHPYYREYHGYSPGMFPEAERFYESVVSLPLYPSLSQTERERVVEAVLTVADAAV